MSFTPSSAPDNMGALRDARLVTLAAGESTGKQQQQTLEILLFIITGSLTGTDEGGAAYNLANGELGVISCGTGTEYQLSNPSANQPVIFFQAELNPNFNNTTPKHKHQTVDSTALHNQFKVLASPYGEYGSLCIRQRARLYGAQVDAGQSISLATHHACWQWVHVTKGKIDVGGIPLGQDEAVAVEDETEITVQATTDNAELMVVEVPVAV